MWKSDIKTDDFVMQFTIMLKGDDLFYYNKIVTRNKNDQKKNFKLIVNLFTRAKAFTIYCIMNRRPYDGI